MKSLIETKKPIIAVTADVYCKMQALVQKSAVEISWHGLVKRNKEEKSYLIYDIMMFPQTNTATTTSADQNEFAKWQTEKITDPDFPIEDLRFHGHSHVNMDVFSSAVDDKYQEDLISKVKKGDYYIFMVLNKRGEMCILLYDFDEHILFETKDVDFEIITSKSEALSVWAEEEMEENVKPIKPFTYPTSKIGQNSITKYENMEWDEYDIFEEEMNRTYLTNDEEELADEIRRKNRKKGKKKNGSK